MPSLIDYPLFNSNMRSGINLIAAATGKPAASIVLECAAKCVAVLFSTCHTGPATFVSVVFVAFSISIHFTPIHPLYERYERPTTNNPITITAIFITFLMA